MEWRKFMGTPAAQVGIDFLRHNHAPRCDGKTDVELLRNALGWGAYQQALKDIEDVLTELPKKEVSLEEPPLNA